MGRPLFHYFLITDSRRTLSISLSQIFFYLDHVSFSHIVSPLHRTEISAARHSGGCDDTECGEAGGEGEGVEGGGGW